MLVGLYEFKRAGVRGRVQAGMVSAASIEWIEGGCLSVRSSEVSVVGIGRGKIVDCEGCLGVGLVGNVGNRVGDRL